jgi:hypothetical protein
MKIGDKVRFIYESGGGVVTGFRGKDIVLVEDKNGFEIPMQVRECVVVDTNEYNFVKKTVAPKETETKRPAVKPVVKVNDDEDDFDPVVTYRPAERPEGEKLNVVLAYLPMDEKSLSNSRFEAYLVNDSNYCLYFTYLTAQGRSWTARANGVLEPNSKMFIDEFGREELNDMERVCVQLLPFKEKKPFALKPAMNIERRIDTVKFYKLHLFRENPFFDEGALIYDLVVDDKPTKEIFTDAEEIKNIILEKKKDGDAPKRQPQPKLTKGSDILEVDLHIDELVDTTAGMNSFDMLNYQLDVVRKTIEENIKYKGKKIVFIHGKGEGVLRNAIMQELRRKYPRCLSQDASFQKYGFGATMVIIK